MQERCARRSGWSRCEAERGEFRQGFLAASVTQLAAPGIDKIDTRMGRVFAAAALGGTAAELGGGKFANGAVTGAFSYAVEEVVRRGRIEQVGNGQIPGGNTLPFVGDAHVVA